MSNKTDIENNNERLENLSNQISNIQSISNNLPIYINTSDATANVNDIVLNKTAYVNGIKLTGTMNNLGDLSITPNITGGTISSGFVNSINISAVNSSIDPNITANNIANGVNILGVIGTYKGSGGGGSGDVKLFDTIANMQNSSGNQDGDLAIVYSSTISNITEDTEFQIGTFPETVVLPTAISNYIEVRFQPVESTGERFNCWGSLSSDTFSIDVFSDDVNIRIQYESSDGIHYTRTTFTKNEETVSGNEMDFDIMIKFGSSWGEAEWDDSIGYFIQTGSVNFNGLFQYANSSFSLAKTQFDTIDSYVYNSIYYGKNGVGIGRLQLNTGLNTFEVKLRRDLINNWQILGISDANGLFKDYTLYNQTNSSYFNTSGLDLSNLISTSSMFNNCINITDSIELITNNVADMSEMFSGCRKLNISTMYNINNFNTANVTNMSGMLRQCFNLVNFVELDTSNVTDMSEMFSGCGNLIAIPNYNTINVSDMSNMFAYCSDLTTVPNFDTSNVTNMYSMFCQCNNKLTTVPNFNTINVTNMGSMFMYCNNLTTVPNFDTSNVSSIDGMFAYCSDLTTVPNFDTSNVTNMYSMFCQCNNNLTTVPNFNTINVTNIDGMFMYCNNLTTVPEFNTIKVNSFHRMFFNCFNLTTVPQFNTSNVTLMQNMFYRCNNLSDDSIQNVINMCLNSNVTNPTWLNLSNSNVYSPLYGSNISNTRYQNRWSDLDNAGWTY